MPVKRTLACLALFGAFVGARATSSLGQQRILSGDEVRRAR
jgi:hypothetical protein